jgi:hypothetical protein
MSIEPIERFRKESVTQGEGRGRKGPALRLTH